MMRKKLFFLKTSLLTLPLLFYGDLLAHPKTKTLSMPSRAASLETISASINSFALGKEELVLFLENKDFFITHPFHGQKANREESFGRLIEGKRIPLPTQVKNFYKPYILQNENKWVLLDGDKAEIVYLSPSYDVLLRKSLILDLLKPAADRYGEPSAFEVDKTRKQFLSALNQVEKNASLKFSGIASFPNAWISHKKLPSKLKRPQPENSSEDWLKDRSTSQFLLMTRIPGFPLLTLSCGSEGFGCKVERTCYLSGLEAKAQLSGIAVSQKRKLLLVGDEKNKKIYLFNTTSCFQMNQVGTLNLPERLKELSSVYVDTDDNLWVSTRHPEDYENASLFRWDKTQW